MHNGNFIASTEHTNDQSAITSSITINSSQCDNKKFIDMDKLEKGTLKVYLTNGTFNLVKFGDATDVRGIIHALTSRLSSDSKERFYESAYGLRLSNAVKNDQVFWVHLDTTISQALEKFKSQVEDDWR